MPSVTIKIDGKNILGGIAQLQAIGPDAKELHLYLINMRKFDLFGRILELIPVGVRHLVIGGQGWSPILSDEEKWQCKPLRKLVLRGLPRALSRIPRGVEVLDLRAHGLGHRTSIFRPGKYSLALKNSLEAIPLELGRLDLSDNSLHSLGSRLPKILAGIRSGIHHLCLRGNRLGQLDNKILQKALSSLGLNIEILDLSDNDLLVSALLPQGRTQGISSRNCQLIFSGLQPSVKTLILRHSHFEALLYLSEEVSTSIFRSLLYVKMLDLSANNLGGNFLPSALKLKNMFMSIPKNVSTVSLYANNLHEFPVDKLDDLSDSLPFVRHVYLSFTEITQMTERQCIALKNIFPLARVILLDDQSRVLGLVAPKANKQEPIQTQSIIQSLYLARAYGLSTEMPSLKLQASFFVKTDPTLFKKFQQPGELPSSLQDYVASLPF